MVKPKSAFTALILDKIVIINIFIRKNTPK